VSSRFVESARQMGALSLLPEALNSGVMIRLLTAGRESASPWLRKLTPLGQSCPTTRLRMAASCAPLGEVSGGDLHADR
jgi:hypothetical protein